MYMNRAPLCQVLLGGLYGFGAEKSFPSELSFLHCLWKDLDVFPNDKFARCVAVPVPWESRRLSYLIASTLVAP